MKLFCMSLEDGEETDDIGIGTWAKIKIKNYQNYQ